MQNLCDKENPLNKIYYMCFYVMQMLVQTKQNTMLGISQECEYMYICLLENSAKVSLEIMNTSVVYR